MTDTDKFVVAIVLVAIVAFAAIVFAMNVADRRLTEAARERFEQLKKATLELEAAARWRPRELGPVGFLHF
jgi:DNA polymerase IIIc chi subunit